MRKPVRMLLRGAAAGGALAAMACCHAADAPQWMNAKEFKWGAAAEPKGAQQAVLWGDAKSSDNGTMLRWAFNTKSTGLVRSQDVHFVVLAGTFTVEVAGDYREFGPGAAVTIPKGVKHTLGCEASGECKLLMHHPGAVEISQIK